jgi:hypothetical protein
LGGVFLFMKSIEHQHAKKVAQWAHKFMLGNGLSLSYFMRSLTGARGILRVATKLKAEGVKRGVPDYCLPVARGRYNGLYLELKAPGGRVTVEQNWWIDKLEDQGYAAGVCYGADEAIRILETYLRD